MLTHKKKRGEEKYAKKSGEALAWVGPIIKREDAFPRRINHFGEEKRQELVGHQGEKGTAIRGNSKSLLMTKKSTQVT